MKKNLIFLLISLSVLITIFLIFSYKANLDLKKIYEQNESAQIFDRNDTLISILKNNMDYYVLYEKNISENFEELIIEKEDKYFYLHPGFNLISIVSDLLSEIGLSSRNGSSTITQQLAKILLKNENNRNFENKIKESFYALSFEIFNSKKEILLMYMNSIYLGNQIQGVKTASLAYFNASPDTITKEQMLQIISSINSPNAFNIIKNENIEKTKLISKALKIDINENYFTNNITAKNNLSSFKINNIPPIEITDYIKSGNKIKLSIDIDLNNIIRESLKNDIESLETKKAKNAAAIVISIPENEVIAIVGSPDPFSYNDGYQINMLKEVRQIGSTIKPFIYLKAFEKGMRPYTLIDDKEYKYELGDASPFYPKNYDYKYNGLITAHYGLSNSINLASLKTLEFVGLDNFTDFIQNDLSKEPVQEIQNYGLGIALGAFEMNLIDLAHVFTIFPNYGAYKDLTFNLNHQNNDAEQIVNKPYIELINKILNDRKISIDQFGANSLLNLSQNNYALKTGTSQNYKDSLIVGYTPDFLVAVWVGNADATETEGLSGQLGAGLIWNSIMELMINSPYNYKTEFDFSHIKTFENGNNLEWGLDNDDYEKSKNMLIEKDDSLILNLHHNDVFLFEENSEIKLEAKNICNWFINDEPYYDEFFKPLQKGVYKITAKNNDLSETIYIYFE